MYELVGFKNITGAFGFFTFGSVKISLQTEIYEIFL